MARDRLVVALGVLVILTAGLSAHAQGAATAPGVRFVELDGRRVRVQTLGLETRKPGQPVVILEAGASNTLDVWSRVVPQVAPVAPLIAYDRAGLGQSDWDEQTPTPQHAVARLGRVLDATAVKPPYVVVGYSWGAVLAHYFAGYHPADVAGLVFVDPGPIVTESLAEQLAPFEAVGAGRRGYDAYWSALGALMKDRPPAARAEFEVLRRLMDAEVERRGLKPLPAVPVAMIVAAKALPLAALQLPFDARAQFEADVRHRIRQLQEWALRSPRGTLVVSNATTHLVPREDPDLIVWAVKRVLDNVGK
jgi:pimeloyl-ACP methyl ester carboxylesterase